MVRAYITSNKVNVFTLLKIILVALCKSNQRFRIFLLHHIHFRGHKFYGKSIIEGVQHPSETIYMPHYTNHAVYNLDQTIAVGDNPFYNTAIEESAFQLFRNGMNPYSYIKDFQIHLYKGINKIYKLPT